MTATFEQLAHEVDAVLRDFGYVRLPVDVAIGGIPFKLQNAYVAGEGYLDLVLLMNVCDEEAAVDQAYWTVERVARALDNAESRRPLTVILACAATPSASAADGLLRLGRVLFVDDPERVREQLAPMLPVKFADAPTAEPDPLGQLNVRSFRDGDKVEIERLLRSARSPDVVESALMSWLDQAFESGDEGLE